MRRPQRNRGIVVPEMLSLSRAGPTGLGNDSNPVFGRAMPDEKPGIIPPGLDGGLPPGIPPGVGLPHPGGIHWQSRHPSGVYLSTQRAFFAFADNTVEHMVLPEPDGSRVFLNLRNPSTSVGTLLISFGISIASTAVGGPDFLGCDLELDPGEHAVFDFFVPQQRIFARASDIANCVVSWSEYKGPK